MKTIRSTAFLATVLGLYNTVGAAPFNPPAGIDPSFGNNGLPNVVVGTAYDVQDLAVGRDAGIVAIHQPFGGGTTNINLFKLNSGGVLDTSFNGSGQVSTLTPGTSSSVVAVRIQRDNKPLVLAQYFRDGLTRSAVFRYSANGSLDPNFGQGGVAEIKLGSLSLIARTIAVQKDGKIVVVCVSRKPNLDLQVHVVRLLSNGKQDPAFGTGGRFTYSTSLSLLANVVDVGVGGRILVACQAADDNLVTKHTVLALLPQGSLDGSFGKGGVVNLDLEGDYAMPFAIKALGDGRFLLGGNSSVANAIRINVAQFLPNGKLNRTFGGGGVATVTSSNPNALFQGSDLILQPDGKILVGGQFRISSGGYALLSIWRFDKRGQPDADFGSDAQRFYDFGSNAYEPRLALQESGEILAATYFDSTPLLVRAFNGPHPADARVGKDVSVKKGDGFFNFSGIGSTQNVVLRRGESRTLFFAVQNEGIGKQSFTCNATPGYNDFTVEYTAGGVDVTNALSQLANYQTPLIKRKALSLIKVKVKNVNMTPGDSYALDFVTTSDLDNSSDLSRLSFTFE